MPTADQLWAGGPVQPHPWQAEALPAVLAAVRRRERAIVAAVMGAGKSHVQGALIRAALAKSEGRVIVALVPSQDLVEQLAGTLRLWCGDEAVGVFYGRRKQAGRQVVVCCNLSLPALLDALAGKPCSLVVVDEAHKSEGQTLLDGIPRLRPAAQVGFTATPLRSVPKERLSLWDSVAYRYTMADALRDGVLVPLRVVRVEGTEERALDDACLEMVRAEGRGPGIVSATSTDDADDYAEWLTEQGVPSLSIHSKMTPGDRVARLDALRAGQVRCLVHVSLLAEGVDLPWLRWLCMRRKVGASVRFLQELGRPMRRDWDDPTKVECVVMDPHMLLGRFGLHPAEAIGAALEQAAEAEAQEGSARGDVVLTEAQAVVFDALLEHLAQVRASMVWAGMITPREVEDDGWTLADVSQRQVDALRKVRRLTKHVPKRHRPAIKALAQLPYALTRGQAALLLDVLIGGARWARAEADARGLEGRDRWGLTWDAGVCADRPPVVGVEEVEKVGRRIEARAARAAKKEAV